MPIQETIRELDARGVAWREIARRVGVSRNTVAKYAMREDYSPQPGVDVPGRSKADEFGAVITAWLVADQGMPRKQRHTAQRVFDRLVDEYGFTGSYSSVQRWVKRWRAAHRSEADGYAELSWEPGVAQVDYGQADVVIADARVRVHVLVVTWPYSNMRAAVVTAGENAECVCSGLRSIFEHVGGVPTKLVFDNATGVGHRRSDGQVTTTSVFDAFRAHYRCRVEFCNPYSGNEKGSVENAVGFIRRNLMVPMPTARTMEGLSDVLLSRCDELANTEHYRKQVPIARLFDDDRAAMLGLPGIGFDACRWETRVVDKVGNVEIDSARYAAGASHAGQRVHVGLRHSTVAILDATGQTIITLPRAYGRPVTTIHDPATLLAVLTRKPRAWGESILRGDTPAPLRDAIDQAAPAEATRLLRILSAVTASEGFAAAAGAMARIITDRRNITRPEVLMLAKRLAQDNAPTRHGGDQQGSAATKASHVDLSVYDRFTRHDHHDGQAAS